MKIELRLLLGLGILLVLVLLFRLSSETVSPADPDLYYKDYDLKPASGKPLRMTIQEVGRTEATSQLVVTFKSGASVASSMAIARAACDIAKIRKKPFFINLKEWDGRNGMRNYIFGFADGKEPNPLSFFGIEDSDKTGDSLMYLSVKDFDQLFEEGRQTGS
jgi:hypothetical protein